MKIYAHKNVSDKAIQVAEDMSRLLEGSGLKALEAMGILVALAANIGVKYQFSYFTVIGMLSEAWHALVSHEKEKPELRKVVKATEGEAN